jgi:SAM-dependent methyltransferase
MESFSPNDWIRHWIYQYALEELQAMSWERDYYNIVEVGAGGNTDSATIQMLRKLIGPNKITFAATDMDTDDIQSMPKICTGCIDVLIADEVLEHVKKPWIAAEEIWRVLRPGGLAILYAPFMYPLHLAPIDVWRLSPTAYEVIFPINRWYHEACRTWGGKEMIHAYMDSEDHKTGQPGMHSVAWAERNIGGFLHPQADNYPSLVLWIGRKKF